MSIKHLNVIKTFFNIRTSKGSGKGFYQQFFRLVLCYALITNFSLPYSIAADVPSSPKVVASVLPLQSLIASVMEGVGRPLGLLKANLSPHTYILKPKDARLLAQADIVFWIGPGLEGFLKKPLQNLVRKGEVYKALEAPGLTLYPLRHEHHTAEEEDHHHEGTIDPHIWLDPRNAIVLLGWIEQILAKHDPGNAKIYKQNTLNAKKRLQALTKEMRTTLTPFKKVPFLVHHDGYQYFEKAFGLNSQGAVRVSPELPVQPERLRALKEKLRDQKIRCVFSEAQLSPKLLEVLTRGTGIKLGHLDPYGSSIDTNRLTLLYKLMMFKITQDVKECLSNE